MELIDKILREAEGRIKDATGIAMVVSAVPEPKYLKMKPETMCFVIGASMGLTNTEMKCKHRNRHLVIYRQLCCYFLKMYYKTISLGKIAALANLGDHTSAIHGINTVRKYLDTGDEWMVDAYNKAIKGITNLELAPDYY